MLFNLFRRKIGGVIASLGLEDFYITLTETEKNELRKALANPYQLSTGVAYIEKDLDSGSRKFSGGEWSFLHTFGNSGVSSNLKEKMLLLSQNYARDAWELHFSRQSLAELYYMQAQYDKCESYCLEDINSVNEFIDTIDYLKDAQIGTFKRLAILYEKQQRYDEAIKISEKALKIGQHDGTKSGYEGRINRLKKKLGT